MNDLERLDVWRSAKDLTILVYQRIVANLPPEEKYALGLQIRKAAVSIPANIAEGHGRYYYQDGIRFSYIARGSAEELISHIEICRELGYVDEKNHQEIILAVRNVLRLINGYIGYLKKSKIGTGENESKSILREKVGDYDVAIEPDS